MKLTEKEIEELKHRGTDYLSYADMLNLLNTALALYKERGKLAWHKYPEEKPDFGIFIVTDMGDGCMDLLHVVDQESLNEMIDDDVIGWAEINYPEAK